MAKDTKKRGRRAYLNDFERDLTGSYRYRGSHYRYAGSLPRSRALAGLWGLSLGTLAALLAAGMMDGPGLGRCFYVIIPYAAAFVASISVVYTVGRLSFNEDPLREYVLEQTVRKLPVRSAVTLAFSALSAAGGVVYLALNGLNWQRAVFVALCAAALAAQVILRRLTGRMDWQKLEETACRNPEESAGESAPEEKNAD
ncbi:hypothetical protein INF35_12375 [Subdoligranulum sp. DSM 109015]|uniref:Uncharacterized protein n=1 Tax=Gemmiger gallinarum TaxID=2779354 RepID=A0ABR9R600_9FIRM|nr:hypothetical protein [Gemmiger gallinarum]MBE5038585.1 hypothetical protein [Gemmiger gallinarum]